MDKNYLDITAKGFYPKIIVDYLRGDKKLIPFYKYQPEISGFKSAIEDFSETEFNRGLLVRVLKEQFYHDKNESAAVSSLLDDNTFTVCTGHQLCILTGPLYFIYKIISTINLAETLSKQFPGYRFVPVYWMAAEDHDFEEINHITIYGKKLEWTKELAFKNEEAQWITGNIPTHSLKDFHEALKNLLGTGDHAERVLRLFNEAYLNNDNLEDATRYLVHELFGRYGLITIDGNDSRLKNEFSSIMKEDLLNHTNYAIVNTTISQLQDFSYNHQVNPREINLFYLDGNQRIRIEQTEQKFMEELDSHPGNFSPNVVLRPLFQQKILPNIAYVGGPNEIAYWLQYKKMFDRHGINYPVLMLRNSVTWIDARSQETMKKCKINTDDLFEPEDDLVKIFIHKNNAAPVSLANEKEQVSKLFAAIIKKAGETDPSLIRAAEAEMQRTINALENLEKKLIRSEKQKFEAGITRVKKLKEKLFPGGNLQERVENFIPYYLKYGDSLFEQLKVNLDPFVTKHLLMTD